MHDNPSSAGKKKNKMPRGDRASLAGASLADDAGMRVSVTWEQVNPDAQRAPMTDIDNLNLPKVTPPSPSKLPPLRDAPHPPPPVVTERPSSSTAMDLDDVPVTGAPHKDFETLLQEQLAKEGGGGGMGGGAEPAKNAKTPPGATPRSASARKFLRNGARNERTTLTPPGIKAAHPTLKPSKKAAGSKAAASHTSKTIDYGFDDSEPIEDVKPKAVKPKGGRGRVPSPGATKRQDARLARENDEAAELAEFEALERELAVVDPSSEQRTAPGPSFKPAAKKSAQAAALRAAATRALEDENGESDSSDGDDEFAVEDHFGGALRSASHVKGPSVPVAFDDDEEFSEDEAADAAAYDNYPQNDHFRRAEPSSMGVNSVDTNRHQLESVSGAAASVHDDAPGDGAPALIQSLFYNGNEGRKGSRVGSRVVDAGYKPDAGAKRLPNPGSLSTQKANSDAAMAKAQAAAASAAEVKAAADDASARVKRERDRLEREKSAFAQEKRAAVRERQTWEKQRKDATASIASEREEIKADADRLRRDRQRLERDSKRVLSALPTKKERTEMDDLREKLARAQEDQRAKDTKQRHTVDRLRAQIADLQTECAELKGEKRRLEQQILDGGAQGAPKRY